MGLLDAIFSESDRAKRYVKGLLGDPFGVAQQAIGNVADNTRGLLDALRADPNSDASYQGLMALAGAAPVGMTVWHGSPHDIQPKPGGKYPEFDMSKIGTGEGAQAYGHGIYTADAKDVGTRYRDTLTNFRPDHIEASLIARGISPEMANTYAQFAAQKQGGPRAFDDFASALMEKSPSPYIEQFRERMRQEMPKLKDELGSISGYLYKVDIPDEAVARFLDWDKPLSQQAPEVQKAIRNSPIGNRPDLDNLSGNSLHDLLMFDAQDKIAAITGKTRNGSQQDSVSKYLQNNGVPGIRYLDGGSRSAGNGTSNFVLFSDQLPRIIEVNGVPTGQQPWKPGEWNPGLLGGM